MKRRAKPVEETIADYDVRSPAARTVLTVAGTLAGVVAIAGIVLGLSLLAKDTRVATSEVDVSESAQLRFVGTEANLHIVEGEDDLLVITSSVTSGLRKTDYQLGRRGDEIRIISGCQEWLNPGCGVDVTLKVPPGLPLEIVTTTGDVDATAISQGVLTVGSTTGDITASELGVDEFSASTSSGVVSAQFAEQPFAFKATTIDGAVDAVIPSGDRAYDVTTRSESGRVRSDLDSTAEGDGFVRVTTMTGDITLSTP
ncbi:DUF4097 family beta strand repeat-containing protein [Aeromicrobium sp. CF3.5]|uniref:DUF4097 family beta strand repeat-containing protein n=1 Tax=Aeromicrobium sp. CF3.5 TaxID=3373078 RepID=UPI003EE67D76